MGHCTGNRSNRSAVVFAMQSTVTFGHRGINTVSHEVRPTANAEFGRQTSRIEQILFDTRGRIPRLHFWIGRIFCIGVLILVTNLLKALNEAIKDGGGAPPSVSTLILVLVGILMLVVVLSLTCWALFALQVKRWHDRDKSWTWALLGFLPIIGWLWQGIECSYLEGTLGPNRFGPSPKGIVGVTREAISDR
jgi:uncharacterized membrane protein YhaH (DUF805 family)